MANIFNNDNSPYKNIYDYVAAIILKNPDYQECEGLISKKLMKMIIMPGAYGQTNFTLFQKVAAEFENNPY